MSSNEQLSHIAIAVHIGWGHARPLVALAARVVKLRAVNVTFLTIGQMYEQAVKEVARNFADGEDALRARIRVVCLPAHETDWLDRDIIGNGFEEQLRRLLAGERVSCTKQEAELPTLKPPSALVLDMCGHQFYEIARKLSPTLKIVVSTPPSLIFVLGMTGPYKKDGQREVHAKIESIMRDSEKSLADAAEQVLTAQDDEAMDIPGLPPMYAYEVYPQQSIMDIPGIGLMHLNILDLLYECDAVFSCSMDALEPPETVQAFTDFLALNSRKLYFLGPLLSEAGDEAVVESKEIEKSPEIAGFLKNALEKHGERSLVYISFGTAYWTTKPEQVWTFLDILMEKNIPFIMALASPFCSLPDEVAAKVKASGTGLIVPWAPQQALLEHPVTGWFVTHAGFSSITESVHAGVPMICWPMSADQPLNAVQLVENLDVAYELHEVRTGARGLKPLRRTGTAPQGTPEALRAEMYAVLAKAFGEDGARKRENIRKMRDAARTMWRQGGLARRAAEQLLDDVAV
ncbi:glycosyltransferase family 1 protein [Phanerochaete sordida]|uniref:Glycosyltransferase family 1 protein n=1 Tax=Phanerochaete sordida TaxID=48140 RepID=A0A9P3GC37_9APHY|nr:glycosyltransferase family 1 protein [Phanerochaete sordida]